MRKVLLFCSYRVLHNKGADVMERYVPGICEDGVLILCEGFTSILLFVGFFPSCSYCLALILGD